MTVDTTDTAIIVRFSGEWRTSGCFVDPAFPEVAKGSLPEGIRFDMSTIGAWDSGILIPLLRWNEFAKENGLNLDTRSLPKEIRDLLELASGAPQKEDTRRSAPPGNVFEGVGNSVLAIWKDCREAMDFTGSVCMSVGRLLRGKRCFRMVDFLYVLRTCGPGALPIVTLISFLVGIIIAFLGAVTLKEFGAEIYVSYLVGWGMLREMGALMTGVIMAGRTGAAFAAQIGSMKANEEIDALETMGIDPHDFIVLPRLLALFLMMPLLTMFSNVIGILGGVAVSSGLMGVTWPQFERGLLDVVTGTDLFLGLFKGTVFGAIVAFSGCFRGMQSGGNANAVGEATTSAVVSGITLIIFANAIIDWLAAVYGI